MVRPRLNTERPRCPQGHDGDVLLAGRRVWKGGVFQRARFVCVPKQGERHKFSVPRRQPTGRHPHGDTCPSCDARAGRTGGPITAVDHRFSAAEIAALLIRLGRGTSYREASQAARFDAQRQAIDQFGTRHASRQADLGADYLDAFGAAIDEAVSPQAWPPILILDSKPLGVRAYQAEAWGVEPGRAGALLMAAGTQHPAEWARCWRIGLAGDESAASWLDFLSQIPGEPEWIVCDGGAAIATAVRARWPQAMVYACEYHLRQNLVGAAYADGLALDPAMSLAIRQAQWSAADWEALGRLATTLQAAQVLAWISQRDALVRQQIAARRTHRGYPRGNGPAESLLQRVEGWIDARRFNFRNARRLKLLLALMRAELAGDADAARYARLLKDAVEQAHGRPSIAWTAHQDPRSEPCSLSALLVGARGRAAAAETSYMTSAKARSVLRIVAAGNAARAASGLPPLEATIMPGRRTASVKVAGLLLSDFPDIYAEWADDLNTINKLTVRAGTRQIAHWRCAAGHTWATPVNRRTIRQTRCGDCHTARANTTNSVAALWPELLAEWDPEANLPLTPERTKITYQRTVWWRCLDNRDHPPYRMTPRTRGGRDVACRACRRERRERQNRKRAA